MTFTNNQTYNPAAFLDDLWRAGKTILLEVSMCLRTLLVPFLLSASLMAASHRPVCPGPAAFGTGRCHARVVTDSRGVPAAAATPSKPGRYTLQVAALAKRSDADALAKRLKARGLDVRIVGSSKPYRVRIGRYETRAAAAAAARQLKSKKIDAFVTDIGPDDK